MNKLYLGGTLGLALLANMSLTADENWQSHVDFARADKQPLSMVLIKDGKPSGSMAYSWQQRGDVYVFEDRTEMQPNILETATGVIDAISFMPRRVDIDFAVGENRNVFDFDWQNGSLSGQVTIHKKGEETRVVPVSSTDEAVLRLAVFGIISALPLADGFEISLPWFNTLSNKLETVNITHAGTENVATPAGTFEAHKVNLTGGSTENIIYVTTALPQKIVRIDVVGQALHFERNSDE